MEAEVGYKIHSKLMFGTQTDTCTLCAGAHSLWSQNWLYSLKLRPALCVLERTVCDHRIDSIHSNWDLHSVCWSSQFVITELTLFTQTETCTLCAGAHSLWSQNWLYSLKLRPALSVLELTVCDHRIDSIHSNWDLHSVCWSSQFVITELTLFTQTETCTQCAGAHSLWSQNWLYSLKLRPALSVLELTVCDHRIDSIHSNWDLHSVCWSSQFVITELTLFTQTETCTQCAGAHSLWSQNWLYSLKLIPALCVLELTVCDHRIDSIHSNWDLHSVCWSSQFVITELTLFTQTETCTLCAGAQFVITQLTLFTQTETCTLCAGAHSLWSQNWLYSLKLRPALSVLELTVCDHRIDSIHSNWDLHSVCWSSQFVITELTLFTQTETCTQCAGAHSLWSQNWLYSLKLIPALSVLELTVCDHRIDSIHSNWYLHSVCWSSQFVITELTLFTQTETCTQCAGAHSLWSQNWLYSLKLRPALSVLELTVCDHRIDSIHSNWDLHSVCWSSQFVITELTLFTQTETCTQCAGAHSLWSQNWLYSLKLRPALCVPSVCWSSVCDHTIDSILE